jgi:hypothetical protein
MHYICHAKTTNFFCDFLTFVKFYKRNLGNNVTIELMTHPGKEWSVEESKILEDDWIQRMLWPIELISYKKL